ncbi:MAG: DUF4214 domain-containing protein [Burkholderiaceae bacterium]|nr:DUF4214 domain-containing protein [Burkholderiaceae bacterium]
MATSTALVTIQKLYIAYYGRAADSDGQVYWANRLDTAQGSLTGIVDAFANSAEAQAIYGTGTTTTDRVTTLYQNILGRTPDPVGRDFYVGQVDSGRISLVNLALAILEGVRPGSIDAPLADNRLSAANSFTYQDSLRTPITSSDPVAGGVVAGAIKRSFLKTITGDPATLSTANEQLAAWLNTMTVAFRQPAKFAPLISNGLLTNTAIVSTTLTEANLDAAIQSLDQNKGIGPEDSPGISITLSKSPSSDSTDSFVIKSLPINGTLFNSDKVLGVGAVVTAMNGTAVLTFVPARNFNGNTDFTFAAKNNAGVESAARSTAAISVTSVNDAPIGLTDIASTRQGIPIAIDVLANDTDVDNANNGNGGLVIKLGSVQVNAAQGSATIQNGKIVFTPAANFSGTATMTYVVSDGVLDSSPIQVTVGVAPSNSQYPIGTAGNDMLDGGLGADSINGLAGNDKITGFDGNDTLVGGLGADSLSGNAGNDVLEAGEAGTHTDDSDNTLFGDDGDDVLHGADVVNRADSLEGGSGNDTLYGYAGNDTLYGRAGNDTLYGHSGDDKLYGGDGEGLLDGGDGNDTLVCSDFPSNPWISSNSGNHTLLGGNGDDVLEGAQGNDLLVGGEGNDTLHLSMGIDVLLGGAGNDVFRVWNTGSPNFTRMEGCAGIDRFVLSGNRSDTTQSTATVSDFAAGSTGDVIDVYSLLSTSSNYATGNPFNSTQGYFRLVQSGFDTLVQWDSDGAVGSASTWRTVLTLTGVQATALTADNFAPTLAPGGGV